MRLPIKITSYYVMFDYYLQIIANKLILTDYFNESANTHHPWFRKGKKLLRFIIHAKCI